MKAVSIGDMLEIRIGHFVFVVAVRGLSPRRGPASEAVNLYAEAEELRRPTKRDRRHIIRFTGGV
ncbi:MAG: hypothetical protein ACYCTY_16260 [Sulfuricella sp.]